MVPQKSKQGYSSGPLTLTPGATLPRPQCLEFLYLGVILNTRGGRLVAHEGHKSTNGVLGSCYISAHKWSASVWVRGTEHQDSSYKSSSDVIVLTSSKRVLTALFQGILAEKGPLYWASALTLQPSSGAGCCKCSIKNNTVLLTWSAGAALPVPV